MNRVLSLPRVRATGRSLRYLASSLVAAGSLVSFAGSGGAVCVPFPCDGCWVSNSGQLNLVVVDRAGGTVSLVPNIRFQGESPVIALVVPTPAVPTLSEVPSRIWTEASALTAPASRRLTNDGFGCGTSDVAVIAPAEADDGGVIVLSEQTVGGFVATILTSDDPNALVDWLEAEGFPVSPSDAQRFAPYIADSWFFTAMKSDPDLLMPQGGWNANVNPVEFRWSGSRFEVPLELLEINRASFLPMTFFVIDDHRSQLVDFVASYANRISASELSAIREIYPSLGHYLQEGQFLTRLNRNFFADTPMNGRIALERAANDDEFRNGWGSPGPVPGWRPASLGSSWVALVAWLAGALALFGRWVKRRMGTERPVG